MNLDHKLFQVFCDKIGPEETDEIFSILGDAMWNRDSKTVKFTDIYQHDSCNHTYTGTIDYNDQTYKFIIENGNNRGTVIHEWGDPDDIGTFEHPEPVRYMFVPVDDFLESKSPAMYGVYTYWTQQDWFKKKLQEYHYDTHFQPGCLIDEHYGKWAAQKGLKITRL